MLRIPENLYAELRRHGEETYPHECCGVLLGRAENGVNHALELARAGNTRTDSAHNRYSIAPAELIKIQRRARDAGLDIIGFYHSHPDHPAWWSATDLAEAHWLGCSYVITAVDLGRAVTTNAFLLAGSGEDDKRFAQQEIKITSSDTISTGAPGPSSGQ
jgi:proteasome lid subunit RPN8/RPN11